MVSVGHLYVVMWHGYSDTDARVFRHVRHHMHWHDHKANTVMYCRFVDFDIHLDFSFTPECRHTVCVVSVVYLELMHWMWRGQPVADTHMCGNLWHDMPWCHIADTVLQYWFQSQSKFYCFVFNIAHRHTICVVGLVSLGHVHVVVWDGIADQHSHVCGYMRHELLWALNTSTGMHHWFAILTQHTS